MNLRDEFNRIGHLFHNGVDQTQKATADWAEKQTKQAGGIARQIRGQVRGQMDAGTQTLVSAEEAMVRHVRENPALYLMGAALIVGALLAKLILESRSRRQAPLL